MAAEDTEITLGTGKLLGLFFLLAATCGIFFAIGYSLGKTSAREQALNDRAAETSAASQETQINKPSAVAKTPAGNPPASDGPEGAPKESEPDLTFYKAVKQNPEDRKEDSKLQSAKPAPGPDGKKPEPSTPPQGKESGSPPPTGGSTVATAKTPKPGDSSSARTSLQPTPATGPNGAYVVQIAAVSHEEDAAALAGALRKKSYTAAVVNNPTKDKLFHVVLGPYATLQDAEAMKVKLQGEGYSPIIKR
jgi:cell division septation protein DedD